MHIDPNDKIIIPACPKNTPVPEKTKDRAFSEILNQLAGMPEDSESPSKRAQSMDNVCMAELNPFIYGEKTRIVEGAHGLLDIFSEYQHKLADPSCSLKDIAPLVNQMELDNASLISALNLLPDGDRLKGIINQILIASSLEVLKFNRGDYVGP
ncbi:conserved hypothetical protein [uncultured Desulfobacterium sp.]|uniref:Uncharacterized protein n=1 Tax=uncultured Desulfobacterium sp. TaxID=201089 RepID=A0A445MZA4_9BACT|nr:conserved hypothetical protein [uncultured Desulfobacterium sp.]